VLSASDKRLVVKQVEIRRLSSFLKSSQLLDGRRQRLDVTLVTTACNTTQHCAMLPVVTRNSSNAQVFNDTVTQS